MEKVGFDYYKNVFLGSEITSQKTFEKLERYALSYIDKITFGRITYMSESIKCAVCSVCEALFKQNARSGIKQETNDSYSVTYLENSSGEFSDLYMSASVFLPSELLYKGI
ncbi:MAG: hypothetical protein IJE46_06090 [Clostridia bacterium]|nr:hypothetical protein [Clostridia bacterium]